MGNLQNMEELDWIWKGILTYTVSISIDLRIFIKTMIGSLRIGRAGIWKSGVTENERMSERTVNTEKINRLSVSGECLQTLPPETTKPIFLKGNLGYGNILYPPIHSLFLHHFPWALKRPLPLTEGLVHILIFSVFTVRSLIRPFSITHLSRCQLFRFLNFRSSF